MKSISKSYRIAVIPGDGIGKEVTAEAQKVVNAAGEACGFGVEWHPYPFGADHYLRTGEIFPTPSSANSNSARPCSSAPSATPESNRAFSNGAFCCGFASTTTCS
jgi:isocitrate/isopropylmalate dehydrogenase